MRVWKNKTHQPCWSLGQISAFLGTASLNSIMKATSEINEIMCDLAMWSYFICVIVSGFFWWGVLLAWNCTLNRFWCCYAYDTSGLDDLTYAHNVAWFILLWSPYHMAFVIMGTIIPCIVFKAILQVLTLKSIWFWQPSGWGMSDQWVVHQKVPFTWHHCVGVVM